MKFFSYLILYLLFSFTLSANDPKLQYFVDAKGGLHLREEPSEKSKSILLIPDKSEIQIIKEVGDEIKLNEKSGHWTKIKFGNKKGFVFGAYIRKYFLFDKKFSPNKKMFYEYYTPEVNYNSQCSSHNVNDSPRECFIKIYNFKYRKLISLLNYKNHSLPLGEFENIIWFEANDWYDDKSLLITDSVNDGGYSSTDIGFLNIYSLKYSVILKSEMGECNNQGKIVIELVEFNGLTYYRIDSENPKLQTGYFRILKPKADDYDKLLESCKRDPKNSVLVKPITIVRKNYTFKINSKTVSLYFKGKDILKLEK